MPEIQKALYDIQGNKINQETSAAAVSVSDTSNYFPETDAEGVLKNLGARTHFPATNLVTNGDFSNGTTGFNISGATSSVSSNILTLTGNGTGTLMSAVSTTGARIAGNKYYCASKIKPVSVQPTKIGLTIAGVGDQGLIINPNLGATYRLSGIATASSNATGFIVIPTITYGSTTTTSNIAEISEVLCINLTTTFGAGNEPTLAEMDAIMAEYPNSWFDGTANPLLTPKQMLDLIRAKANIVQEAWITPTLVNGWTQSDSANYPVQYFKDSLGFVHVRGRLGTGANNTVAFTIPSGYRPSKTVQFVLSDGSSVGMGKASISSYGEFKINFYTTFIQVDAVIYRAEA